MPLWIRHDDPRLTWHGALSLQRTPDGTQPWRLPHDRLDLFPPADLPQRAAITSGVRLAFHTDSDVVAGEFEAEPSLATVADACKNLDLCVDGAPHARFNYVGQRRFHFGGLPAGDKRIELWLSHTGPFRLRGLELADGATLAPFHDNRPRWLTYGSSITQASRSASPTQTWPAIVAQARGLNLTNLGYGGQCHLDMMIARLMRDLPADVITMCVGINIHSLNSLSLRTFRASIIGFVQIVREQHPDTPLAVISPITAPAHEDKPNQVELTLDIMRAEVLAAVTAMQAHGDHNLRYVHGPDLFGPAFGHLMPDGLHPDAEGNRVLGQRFVDMVMAKIFP